MTVHTFSPDGLLQPVPYDHVSVSTGSRHVHVAGQIAREGDGAHVAPGDLRGQVSQALRNTARGLASAGAGFRDVVRLRFFATRWRPELMDEFMQGIEDVRTELDIPTPMPPLSLIGVEILFEPDVLIEVEAYALLE
jgi:enamine deaminase RidA (YjgF/YER057c/UK114 family)